MKGNIKWKVDFGGIANEIAAATAMAELSEDPKYMGDLIDRAIDGQEQRFNQFASSYAMANPGTINHMFEWGTLGINKRRTNRRPSPNSPAARLWSTVTSGSGMNKTMTLVFEPSKAFVPPPSKESSGMDADIIAKLRKHVFHSKAMVFETGQAVTVAPHRKFRLVPVSNTSWKTMRPHDLRRGYTLTTKSATFEPGRQVQGNFTSLWTAWWETQGAMAFDGEVEEELLEQYYASRAFSRTRLPSAPIPGALTKEVRTRINQIKAQAKTRIKK